MTGKRNRVNLYVGKVEKAAAESLAAEMGRSLSEELQWLLALGIDSAHHLPARPASEIHGDEHVRVNIYPHITFSERVDMLLISRNRLLSEQQELCRRWSRSSLCRSLIEIGIRIERQLLNQIEVFKSRLKTASEVIDHHTFARYLFVRHPIDHIEAMVNTEPPEDELALWGITAEEYIAGANLAAELHFTWRNDE